MAAAPSVATATVVDNDVGYNGRHLHNHFDDDDEAVLAPNDAVMVEADPSSSSSLRKPLLSSASATTTKPSAARADCTYNDGLPFQTSIVIKSLYLLNALANSTWGRFAAIYYNSHGLSPKQIGLIEGLGSSFAHTTGMFFWGYVSDKFQARKEVWVITKTCYTMILLMLAFPFIYNSYVRILAVAVTAQFFISQAILDSHTLDLLGNKNKMFYGRYRMYASLGWGLGSVTMGYIANRFLSFENNFVPFGILSGLMIMLVAKQIPSASSFSGDGKEDTTSHHHLMELVQLALRPRVTIFLLEVVIMGATMATVERLLFLYLVNELHASTLLCGISAGVNIVFEAPIFWYASRCMKKFGHDGMYIIAFTCFFLRVFGYTLLTPSTKWLVLLLEIMHGITFGCFWIVSTDISKILVHQAGAHWATTIPSVVHILYSAVGVSLGSFFGGWAMHQYGSRRMYKQTSGIVFTMLMLHVMGSIVARRTTNFADRGIKGRSFLPDFDMVEEEFQSDDEEEVIECDDKEKPRRKWELGQHEKTHDQDHQRMRRR